MAAGLARSLVFVVLTTFGLAAGAVDSPPVKEEVAHAVRAVIEAQLDALAADDAVRAFSYAAPVVRDRFGDAPTFMAMVREGYPMLIRPTAHSYFIPEGTDNEILQVVQVRDQDGHAWKATYLLQRQPDDNWRIGGCAVVLDNGAPMTRADQTLLAI